MIQNNIDFGALRRGQIKSLKWSITYAIDKTPIRRRQGGYKGSLPVIVTLPLSKNSGTSPLGFGKPGTETYSIAAFATLPPRADLSFLDDICMKTSPAPSSSW